MGKDGDSKSPLTAKASRDDIIRANDGGYIGLASGILSPLVKLDMRMFTSKVARRAFVLFVACALLPVSVLAVISFRQVTAELHEQSERRLRQASKSVGLALHKRLLALDVAIEPTVQRIQNQLDEGLQRPFVGVVHVTADGRSHPLSGHMSQLPTLTPEQSRHVAAGKTLLSTEPREAGSPRFFVSRALDRQHLDRGTLHGEVNPAYIWAWRTRPSSSRARS